MTVFAAIAAGHSATPCDVNRVAPACVPTAPPPFTGGAYPNYGGGLENFPRFLENWGGVTMTYRGLAGVALPERVRQAPALVLAELLQPADP